jgi:hypothetical protein
MKLSYGDSGAEVLRLQEALRELNFYAFKMDGVFGPRTLAAVKLAQDHFGLPPTGETDAILEELLWPDLAAQAVADSKDLAEGLSEWHRMFLAVLKEQVGVREVGGENRGPQVEKYQKDCGGWPGLPWCLYCVQWCAKEASRRLGRVDALTPDTGHCLTLYAACKEKGWTLPASEALPGDLVIMSFGGGRGHVFVVEGRTHGRFISLEGNTNGDGSREGDGFYRKDTRPVNSSLYRGAIRIPDPAPLPSSQTKKPKASK